MTNKLGVSPRARRFVTTRALVAGLVLAGLLGLRPPPASAAAIRAHRAPTQTHTTASQRLQNELASFQSLVNGWESQLGLTRPAQFLNGLSPTNPNGTLKNHALARLMTWDHRVATPTPAASAAPGVASVLSQHASTTAQAQAQQLATTISVPPKSSAFMVLIPPTTGTGTTTRTPVVAPQVMPVPEPSGVASALALLGLAGGWWRLRRVRPRAAS